MNASVAADFMVTVIHAIQSLLVKPLKNHRRHRRRRHRRLNAETATILMNQGWHVWILMNVHNMQIFADEMLTASIDWAVMIASVAAVSTKEVRYAIQIMKMVQQLKNHQHLHRPNADAAIIRMNQRENVSISMNAQHM